jgi:uncharacterized cupredoxin-like copper-binding protein
MHPTRRTPSAQPLLHMSRHVGLLTSAAITVLLLSACSQTASPSPMATPVATTSAGSVHVTLTEFAITPGALTAAAGEVTFTIHNAGAVEHEFIIIRTDLAADALPSSGSAVDEEGLDVIDEVEDMAPGDTATLTVNLEPGNYVVICNLPGHYAQGMRATLQVDR